MQLYNTVGVVDTRRIGACSVGTWVGGGLAEWTQWMVN